MSPPEKTRQLWLEKGYEHFALYGPENLSINKISKETGSPRACFYHYFGDIDVFIEELLNRHLQICQQFNIIGKRTCKNYIPDLYILLEQYPIPLKFNKQLFINRSNPIYNYLFIKVYNDSSKIFILNLFAKQFGLKDNMETFKLWVTVGES